MLFNSIPFLLLYLPVVLVVFFWVARHSHWLAAAWLAAASLFFYGWWDARYLPLLLASIAFNYTVGRALARGDDVGSPRRRWLLAFGVGADLALLGYFKYANFFIATLNTTAGAGISWAEVLLPLGISFFTFTQIAFLVDAARGHAREYSLVHYGLFVTYFPHLIAGPVLHHGEMMPQFKQAKTYRFDSLCFTAGMAIFSLGLFKKVVLADSVAPYASPVFDAAQAGAAVHLLQSWGGALAYTLQLYFDFSGYCDMAIGLSYMFGVKLPINFDSPYKAADIAEFWRRWHMTLSRFLRDYLYIPLGGNRHGPTRRYANLMTTMLLGGLWHGAGWTFVIWGGLHGLYLVLHQAWLALRVRLGWVRERPSRMGRVAAVASTFLAVVVAWVFFRAASLDAALTMLRGMVGLNGVVLPDAVGQRLGSHIDTLAGLGVVFGGGGGREFVATWLWIACLLPVVFFAPNTQQIMARVEPALGKVQASRWPVLTWAPTRAWAWAMALVLACGLLSLTRPSEFLYFQF
jgi:alginate O-acetyltransferase complex protein AlgI